MSLNSTEWGMITKFLYNNFFRKELVKLAARTDTTIDDNAVKILDKISGYKGK